MISGLFAPFRAFWRGLVVFERYGSTFVIANLCALLVSLPLVTFPAAIAGLYHLAYVAHREPTCHLDDFWYGFRHNLLRGLIIGAINIVVISVLVINFNTYRDQSGIPFAALRALWAFGLLIWIAANLYLWAILERMEQPKIQTAYYNAGLMVAKSPAFTIVFMLLVIIVSVICGVLIVPILLFALSLLASISTAAVTDRLGRG